MCLEHTPGRKEDTKTEASGEGHRGAGWWWCGWKVGVGNRKFRRGGREATGKTERGGGERQELEVQPGH